MLVRRPAMILCGLVIAITLAAMPALALEDAAGPDAPRRPLEFTPFEAALEAMTPERIAELDAFVPEATFEGLDAAMAADLLTSVELVTYYLARTRDVDVDALRSMMELNPDALAIAAERDAERAAGQIRGRLHGIPISLKGNIGTGDAMHTTAGAAALADARSDRDATLVTKLRDAGAVILGKANLSEWAYWMHTGPSGYSALGGQVVNPYDPSFDPLGSSTGSAVGTSVNVAAASIGTETAGSIIAPAAVNGVVGMHPSLGLVSRDRVIPISDQLDTPGPITRTVTDAAVLLTAIAGTDPNDPATADAAALEGTDFTAALDAGALEGARVGLFLGPEEADLVEAAGDDASADTLGLVAASSVLEAAGVDLVALPSEPPFLHDLILAVGNNGLRLGYAAYAEATDPSGVMPTIADVIAFNATDPERYAPYGEVLLEAAAASELDRAGYEAAGAELRATARAYLDGLFEEHELDVIISRRNNLSAVYAAAGYPAITVPAGLDADGLPMGLTFTGRYLEDARVIGYAFAFEQAGPLRVVPPVGAVER